MSLNEWEQDLAAYRAVLADIDSGKLTLRQGRDEFLADLKQRIFQLEEMLERPRPSTRRSGNGRRPPAPGP